MDTKQQHTKITTTQKPICKAIVLCNALCFKLKSKKTAKNSFSLIVIPSKTRKKILKYYLQPTLESAFQHSKIETRVQHAPPKEHFKEILTMHSNGQNTRATPKQLRTQKPKPGTRAFFGSAHVPRAFLDRACFSSRRYL